MLPMPINGAPQQIDDIAMSIVVENTLTDLTPTEESRIVHIQGIGVQFKHARENFPISIQIKVDDDSTYESDEFQKDNNILWPVHKQLAPSSQLVIRIREHRRTRSNVDIATVSFAARDLYLKPVVVIDEPNGQPILVNIKCEAAGPFIDLICKLLEESQKRLSNMKVFLEQLGKVCETLNGIVNVALTYPVSDVHTTAQLAVAAVTSLYEHCKKKKGCHEAVPDLMGDIAGFLPFADVPKSRSKSPMTVKIAQEMLLLFAKIALKIIECSSDSSLGIFLNNQSDEVNSYKENFRKLAEFLDSCVKTEIWKTVLSIEEDTDALLLGRLDPVMEAFYKKDRICFDGSRKDTLQAIVDWSASESSSKLLWLHGLARSGKTTITHTAAQLLASEDRLAGCFICDKNYNERRNPERILPTIAYQLAKWHPAYRDEILPVLRGSGELKLRTGLEDQFELLVKQPLTRLPVHLPPEHGPLIVVLDGIDECCESRWPLISYIIKLATIRPWLKVLVSSQKSSKLKALETGDIQQLDVSDPSLDLHHDITALVKLLPDHHDVSSGASEQFEHDVQGFFHSVSASLEMMCSTDARITSEDCIIQRWTMVETLFLLATQALVDKPDYDENVRSLLKDILVEVSWQSPLSEGALLEFLQPLHPEKTPDQLRATISTLHPLVIKDHSDNVQNVFPPLQFLEFLTDEERYGKFGPKLRSTLVRRCLDTMHSHLKFNICRLESSYVRNEEVLDLASRIRAGISDVLRYSCLHWMDHVSRAGDIESLQGPVRDFLLSPKVLYWIEVLSVVGALDAGKNILLKCADHFKEDEGIVCAAQELHKFISDFSPAMEMSTPHVYVSALSWLRPSSLIVSNCKGPFQHRGAAEPYNSSSGVNCDRGSHLNSLGEGLRYARSIAISPDGTSVVAGFEDGMLQIWNTQTGKAIIELLKGHKDAITCLSFSPGGTRVASGSTDKTVQMWDVESGASVAGPFKGHTDSVWAVAYSPDGSRIVSGSDDNTLRIWDAQIGTPISKPLVGHEGLVQAVAYSPDGSRIVSGSRDWTMRIWDAHSGVPVGDPLRGHESVVACVSYSPDGSRIVSGSWDKTGRLWDAQSGSQIGPPMKGHERWVESIGYSADGSRIISGSRDMTLRIWDAQSGAAIGVVPRGESRWDSREDCFVSIASWWPDRISLSPTMQSLIRSDEPLQIPDDGWLRTIDGGIFLWVPPEHRIDVDALSRINWRRVRHGTDWTKIMDCEGSDD